MAVSAGAVYVVRNPLDVAISFAHFRGVPVDQVIDDMATSGFGVATNRENVRVVTGSWSEHVRSWTDRPHPVVLVVRYEDLVDKPTESFGAIARHLLMTPTPEQLEKAIAMTGFDRLRDKEAAGRLCREAGDLGRAVLPRRPAGTVAGGADSRRRSIASSPRTGT